MIRRRLMEKPTKEWKTITDEYVIGANDNRWQMAPTIPVDGDWTEMELTVEEIYGSIQEISGKRLNYTSKYYQYMPGGSADMYALKSPIIYSAKKTGDEIVITRESGCDYVTVKPGSSIVSSAKDCDMGLWIHWGAPINELKVRGTIMYR